ncbi:MAG: hypothetical protein IIZ55_05505 [Firmicutes bacterium]|nr:hypothetical protein [Bacillota bacterium]
MLPIIILKGMGDLAFYYSFAGFFAVKFGADPSMLLITLMLQTAAFAASFMLEEKGRLKIPDKGYGARPKGFTETA